MVNDNAIRLFKQVPFLGILYVLGLIVFAANIVIIIVTGSVYKKYHYMPLFSSVVEIWIVLVVKLFYNTKNIFIKMNIVGIIIETPIVVMQILDIIRIIKSMPFTEVTYPVEILHYVLFIEIFFLWFYLYKLIIIAFSFKKNKTQTTVKYSEVELLINPYTRLQFADV